MSNTPGRVIGKAGVGLTGDVSWAKNQAVADRGRAAELRTATILNELAYRAGGPTVLHDLRIPLPGYQANIDHVVVSGNTVTLIDTKEWKPGFYWTLSGVTRRGFEVFAPADKRTMPAALNALRKFFESRGIHARLAPPLLIVWPSNTRTPLTLWFLRSPEARAVAAPRFQGAPSAFLRRLRTADPGVVAALATLTN